MKEKIEGAESTIKESFRGCRAHSMRFSSRVCRLVSEFKVLGSRRFVKEWP